jgi:uroporphyrinogen decarboxylase
LVQKCVRNYRVFNKKGSAMDVIEPGMTPKDRARAYAAGEEVDRMPISWSAGETTPVLFGYRMPDYYFSADVMVDVESRLADEFHADNMGVGLGLRTLAEALGTELTYPEFDVSYMSKPRLTSLSQVNELSLVDINKDGRLPIIVESFDRLIDKYGDQRNLGSGLAGPLTTAGHLIETETLLRAMVKDKEGVHRLMQFTTDCVVSVAHDLHERLGISLSLAEPMASADLLSKRQFNEFFLPYLKQTVQRLNEFQGKTSMHICGHTRDRWDEVVSSGICAFWVDNCESMRDLKELHGDKIGIVGNVAPVDIIRNGTPEQVDAAVKHCIEDAADNPCGYTLCPGCTVPIGTPRENLVAFVNAAATWGKGSRKGHMPLGIEQG